MVRVLKTLLTSHQNHIRLIIWPISVPSLIWPHQDKCRPVWYKMSIIPEYPDHLHTKMMLILWTWYRQNVLLSFSQNLSLHHLIPMCFCGIYFILIIISTQYLVQALVETFVTSAIIVYIYLALGHDHAEAVINFHVFIACDHIGRFFGRFKIDLLSHIVWLY